MITPVRKKLSKKQKRNLLVDKRLNPNECMCDFEYEDSRKWKYDASLPVVRQVLYRFGVSPYNHEPQMVDILTCAFCGKEWPNVPSYA